MRMINNYILRRLFWSIHPLGWTNLRRIARLHNKHVGRRCFIIGNGPSLNKMDLRLLESEYCFSLNRGYLLYERIGKHTTYHVSINSHVIQQWIPEIIATDSIKFLPWSARHKVPSRSDILLMGGPVKPNPPRFSRDIRRDYWPGATVTYVAMQLAYYLGFQTVYLIGVDHRFQTQGEPHSLIESTGPDPNHFDARYFGKGSKWQLPDLEQSELAYMLARHYFSASGRSIFDATIDGELDIFPKVRFGSLF